MRWVVHVLRPLHALRLLPARVDLEWLRLARKQLTKRNPLHPDLPEIVLRIHHLEDNCRV